MNNPFLFNKDTYNFFGSHPVTGAQLRVTRRHREAKSVACGEAEEQWRLHQSVWGLTAVLCPVTPSGGGRCRRRAVSSAVLVTSVFVPACCSDQMPGRKHLKGGMFFLAHGGRQGDKTWLPAQVLADKKRDWTGNKVTTAPSSS